MENILKGHKKKKLIKVLNVMVLVEFITILLFFISLLFSYLCFSNIDEYERFYTWLKLFAYCWFILLTTSFFSLLNIILMIKVGIFYELWLMWFNFLSIILFVILLIINCMQKNIFYHVWEEYSIFCFLLLMLLPLLIICLIIFIKKYNVWKKVFN